MIKSLVSGEGGRQFPWGVVILLGLAALLGQSWWNDRIPVETVFDAGAVYVEDAQQGQCATIDFDRDIHVPFRGEWKVTFLREAGEGIYITMVPSYVGGNDYRTDVSLPLGGNLNIGWWTWSKTRAVDPCAIAAGRYIMRTVWTVHMPNGGTREVERDSNVFEIKPAAASTGG